MNKSSKTILITGANGFLGSHLVRIFLSDGYRVIIVKRPDSNLYRIKDLIDNLHIIEFNHLNTFFQEIGCVDIVIHTAGNYGRKGEKKEYINEANIKFPIYVSTIAEQFGTKIFINSDTALPSTQNDYANSKSVFRKWGKHFSHKKNINFINIRLHNMYGKGDSLLQFSSYVLNAFIENKSNIALSMGEQKRDFIYISDVVDAYVTIINQLKIIGSGFIEFDVGCGQAVTLREFIEIAKNLTNATTRLDFGKLPYRLNEVMFLEADILRLKSLGWKNKFSLEEGIYQTIKKCQLSKAK
jgi:CDP-paratose synthetase